MIPTYINIHFLNKLCLDGTYFVSGKQFIFVLLNYLKIIVIHKLTFFCIFKLIFIYFDVYYLKIICIISYLYLQIIERFV